ncbi:hypothetical protein BGZ76_002016, partial [Entomortierella beljakovae]
MAKEQLNSQMDPIQQQNLIYHSPSTSPTEIQPTLSQSTISSTTSKITDSLEERSCPLGVTECTPAPWFNRPYHQPSSISTTATSSFMPTEPKPPVLRGCAAAAAAANSSNITPSVSLPLPPKARTPATLFATLQSALATGTVLSPAPKSRQNSHSGSTTHSSRTSGPYSTQDPSSNNSFHKLSHNSIKDDTKHHNPYRAPSHTNSHAFVPPKLPDYEFVGGSQAGNMGLMMGKRISDGFLVTGKLHQSLVLLQHEYRILKRLQIINAKFIPQNNSTTPQHNDKDATSTSTSTSASSKGNTCHSIPGHKEHIYQTGIDDTEKYFNRVVLDFIDLEDEDMSVLILERLGHNLLSHTHHPFLGLEGIEGLNNAETQKLNLGSPFPDVKTFLIFALKAACILEALMSANLAHLAICPTAIHWAPPEPKTEPQHSGNKSETEMGNNNLNIADSPLGPQVLYSMLKDMDVNDTTIRLFDFTHSKILSHERARAPNNIAEWQIPGYLEYHLQFLAPEQTGRAETWMDHRTDIYGLGATLFSLLTMQYPNTGSDSVQILQ